MPLTTAVHRRLLAALVLLLGVAGVGSATPRPSVAQGTQATQAQYIVQAGSAAEAAAAVTQSGGTVIHELAIIDGVAATLDSEAAARLAARGLTLRPDGQVQAGKGPGKETDTEGYRLYPAAATGANLLHERKSRGPKTECKEQKDKTFLVTTSSTQEERPLQGWGVTVAVIDSGFMEMKNAGDWKNKDGATGTLITEDGGRCLIYRDFLPRSAANGNAFMDLKSTNSVDQNGHGTHVLSTIGDNRTTPLTDSLKASPVGVAPQVNLLIARALDKDGMGTYGDVIRAIDWVVVNKARYNVKVLNLSIYAPVTGPYWADPLAQAVMKAWQAGITVVVAAGNEGPEAGTITVPGNVPYVVTVGAIKSGRYTESAADELALYSSRGPTESAFVKPDVLVPATRTIAPMPTGSTLAPLVDAGRLEIKAQVDYEIGSPAKEHAYYQLSGTSMAAAQVSGVAALILQANPALTNDQVKARLMATARPAWDEETNQPVYTIWEQGAGLIATDQAVFTTTTERANEGMDLALDIDPNGTEHYWGNTVWDEATGQFRLVDPQTGQGTQSWSGGQKSWSGGQKSWSGGQKSWSGGTTTWGGSESLWAGSQRPWAGTTTATSTGTALFSELLVGNDQARQIWLSLLLFDRSRG